jgi:hypothetical protein
LESASDFVFVTYCEYVRLFTLIHALLSKKDKPNAGNKFTCASFRKTKEGDAVGLSIGGFCVMNVYI